MFAGCRRARIAMATVATFVLLAALASSRVARAQTLPNPLPPPDTSLAPAGRETDAAASSPAPAAVPQIAPDTLAGSALRERVGDLIKRKQFQQAHELCMLAIQASPKDSLPIFLMGKVHEPWDREVRWMLNVPDEPDPIARPNEPIDTATHPEYKYDERHALLAARSYEEALAREPDRLEYRAALCFFWVDADNSGRVHQLLEWFKANLSRPGVPEVLKEMARRYNEFIRYERAADCLDLLVQAVPDSLPFRLDDAQALLRSARPEEALATLGVALEKHPDDLAVLSQVAHIHMMLGDFGKAKPLLAKLWKQELGNPELALDQAVAAIALDDKDASSALEGCFVLGGETAEAVQKIAGAMRDDMTHKPPLPAAELLSKAHSLAKRGDAGGAWAYVTLARKAGASPLDLAAARRDLYDVLYFEKRELAALDELRALARQHPERKLVLDGAQFTFELGKHYFHWHLVYPAMRFWKQAAAMPDVYNDPVYHLGRAYEQVGQDEDAYDCYLKAAKLPGGGEAEGKIQRKLDSPRCKDIAAKRARAAAAPASSPAPSPH